MRIKFYYKNNLIPKGAGRGTNVHHYAAMIVYLLLQ
jgi:hypothetical protein